VRDPEWLRTVAGMPEGDVEQLAPKLRRANALQSLLFARWGLVMVHFERDLYADPEIDLDARWWELVERFQMVTPPVSPPEGGWASKIHLAVAPVYYHNYLLGDMLASQLNATLNDQHGGVVGNVRAGEHLVEKIFRPGNLLRWDEVVEQATGRPLSAEDFARTLSNAEL
jgi:peptidyl-dipeptidase A